MSIGSFATSDSDSKRRATPLPRPIANMKLFTPDTSIASDVIPSANFGERNKGRVPDMILLHYTGMPDAQGAIAQLCTAGTDVSAHYIVLEDGRIVQCVPEAKRAWHAGVASWAGEDDINSCSIGIEIVNRGHDWGYPEYPLRQVAAVIALCWRIPMLHPRARRIPAKNFPGIRWRIPASAIGFSRRRSCVAKD
jgi:N-acetylmuramoyl-L-alanine amidase